MGKPPSLVIIVRHGARLDAADKHWISSSATPYDPPLTYGGWIQSRTLGNRIASILQAREKPTETKDIKGEVGGERSSSHTDSHIPQTKHNIIIHSSPFLRCVQTAIAISAGIGQFRKGKTAASPDTTSPLPVQSLRSQDGSPRLSPTPELQIAHVPELNDDHTSSKRTRIAQLRIDPFLGEWLSPEYFENIIPPPNSIMMVANAKAELVRPARIVAVTGSRKPSLGNFPGGWSRDRSPASSVDEGDKIVLRPMTAISQASPKSIPTISFANSHMSDARSPHQDSGDDPLTYEPLTPEYAISLVEPIPAGYVAHAQHACVNTDLQWDSMQSPQDWGNGGDYGEEWSKMHRRFRNGLQHMLAFYADHDTPDSGTDPRLAGGDSSEVETVLILVTHGAGCNALIGALTNQPVLLDVGLASLTVAVRKPNAGDFKTNVSQSSRRNRRGSFDLGIANEYVMELTASTEHLRAASNPHTASLPRFDNSPFAANRRATGTPFLEVREQPHRSASGSHGLRPYPVSSMSRMSSGLWGSEIASSVSESSDSDSMPNFGRASTLQAQDTKRIEISKIESFPLRQQTRTTRTSSARGLWNSTTVANDDDSPQRRWTSTEN